MKSLVLVFVLMLTGCTSLPKLGGTAVNTNAQVGQENTQQVVASQENIEGGKTEATVASGYVQSVDARTYDPLLVLLLILGWLLPTPSQIGNGIKGIFSKGSK